MMRFSQGNSPGADNFTVPSQLKPTSNQSISWLKRRKNVTPNVELIKFSKYLCEEGHQIQVINCAGPNRAKICSNK